MRPYDPQNLDPDTESAEPATAAGQNDTAQGSDGNYDPADRQAYMDMPDSDVARQEVDYSYNSSLDMVDPSPVGADPNAVAPVTGAGTPRWIVPGAPVAGAPNVAEAITSSTAEPSTHRVKVVPAGAIDVTPADTSARKADDTGKGGTDTTDDTEAIRADIEHTRSQMSATIDAIQEKLNPQNLVDQAKGAVREATIGRVENMVTEVRNTAQEAGNGFLETIKENPFPAALAAVGLGWLFMKNRGNTRNNYYGTYDRYAADRYAANDRYENYNRYGPGDRYDYRPSGSASGAGGPGAMIGNAQDKLGDVTGQVGRKVGDAAGQVSSTIGGAAGQVRDTVGNVAGSVGDAAGGLVDNAQQKAGDIGTGLQYNAQRAQNTLQRMLYEKPLAVGGAALVIGAAIGMMLPETEPEHRLMGPAKDTVMDKAQSVAQDTMDKVSRVAEQVGTTVQQEAQNQGLTS